MPCIWSSSALLKFTARVLASDIYTLKHPGLSRIVPVPLFFFIQNSIENSPSKILKALLLAIDKYLESGASRLRA